MTTKECNTHRAWYNQRVPVSEGTYGYHHHL